MEPARKKVEFKQVDGAEVVLLIKNNPVTCPLVELAGELFAHRQGFAVNIPLYKDGFTDTDQVRWEHFTNLPVHIRANALGRIVICQS